MPKVNARFFTCPECKQNGRFRKKTYTVFLQNDESPDVPGLIYQEEIEYVCTRCGHVVSKVIIGGGEDAWQRK